MFERITKNPKTTSLAIVLIIFFGAMIWTEKMTSMEGFLCMAGSMTFFFTRDGWKKYDK